MTASMITFPIPEKRKYLNYDQIVAIQEQHDVYGQRLWRKPQLFETLENPEDEISVKQSKTHWVKTFITDFYRIIRGTCFEPIEIEYFYSRKRFEKNQLFRCIGGLYNNTKRWDDHTDQILQDEYEQYNPGKFGNSNRKTIFIHNSILAEE